MKSKLALFPANSAIGADGQLRLGPHRAAELAERFGTPLYVYNVTTIQGQIEKYRQALAHYPGPSRLTYASKAFLCPALARLMTAAGVGLDVASAGELFVAQAGEADPAQMHLHGNNKTALDLSAALEAGVGRIVIDNETELEQLSQLVAGRDQPVGLWLRVRPGIPVETHHAYTVTGQLDSKFGLSLPAAQTVAHQLVAGQYDPLQLKGLHIHLGSHFHQAAPVIEAVETLLEIAISLREENPGWNLKELCPGGGWGVRYHPDDPPMPLTPFVEELSQGVAQGCRRRGLPLPELILEPGRSLVAQAGVALYTVGNRKTSPQARTYVSIDGGLADNPRPALYEARYTALLANRAAEPETETVAIAGPFCESGDRLIEAVALPPARPGDILAMPVAGAYQLSMSSNYNGALKPAVIFIEGETVRVVQRRETFADLIRRDEV